MVLKYAAERKCWIWKSNASIWFPLQRRKTTSLIEDKGKGKAQKAHTCRNPKRHIPLVSLLLWHEMMAVRCFIWSLALRLWSDRAKFNLDNQQKVYIQPPVNVLLFLMLYFMLKGLYSAIP